MSRLIDQLPEPKEILDNKIIVLSKSRTGTFSMYQAFQMLGYKSYHMFECVKHGTTHVRIFEEALRCKYLGEGKPYTKADFDKWLAAYDALVEIPQFFVEEMVEFYPNAKFILTERDLDKWATSVHNSLGYSLRAFHSFPLNGVRMMDDFVSAVASLTEVMTEICFHGKGLEVGMPQAQREVEEHSEKCKKLLHKDKLLVARLEDGFGWDEICPFLGIDKPDFKYPIGNAPAEFERMMTGQMTPIIRNAAVKVVTAVLVPIGGITAWYYMRRR